MSLYDILSIMVELEKSDKKTGRDVSDDEWAQAEDLLASVTLNDPNVRV